MFTSKDKTNIKYLLVIIVLAVVVGGGFIWWQFSILEHAKEGELPRQDETSNWQTYRNEEYGFEIKYPLRFTFSSGGPNFTQQALDAGEQISGTIPPSFDTVIFRDKDDNQFSITIYHLPFHKLNQDYVFGGECGSQFADENLINRVTNLNGVDFLERQQIFGKNKIRIDYCFLSGTNNLIALRVGNIDPIQVSKQNGLVQQMLSTFRFLD